MKNHPVGFYFSQIEWWDGNRMMPPLKFRKLRGKAHSHSANKSKQLIIGPGLSSQASFGNQIKGSINFWWKSWLPKDYLHHWDLAKAIENYNIFLVHK
jgi:hypothetical protein